MLSKRIIPCLDIKDGRTVKGTNFVNLRDAGDPVELAKAYSKKGADELVFLDITATVEKRATLAVLVKEIAKEINIPFTVGGGVRSIEDAALLLQSGAEKIAINSAAVRNPDLVNQISNEFGSQCLVVAIDSKKTQEETQQGNYVFVDGGRTLTTKETLAWGKEVAERGAGEILLTSMDHDGTKDGFAVSLTKEFSENLSIPVIASGGAGNPEDFLEIFEEGKADAALAASIFHFQEVEISELKQYLNSKNIPIRL